MPRFLSACILPVLLWSCAVIPTARVEGRGADTESWWKTQPRGEWSSYERIFPQTPWFEIYKIRPGVTAIYEPGQFEEVISFLIEGDNEVLLFDTGLGISDMRALVRTLTDKPLTVINSHSHYDHIGGNHQFDRIIAIDTPRSRKRQRGLSREATAEYVSQAWMNPAKIAPGFNRNDYAIQPFEIKQFIAEGHVIDLGGRQLEVLHIPGHSPASIALHDVDNQQLYVGDTFYLAPLYAHLEGSVKGQYQETAARLAALAPSLKDVMTSHNVPIVDPGYLIKMDKGFKAIDAGNAKWTRTDGARQYIFDGFSIITSNPP